MKKVEQKFQTSFNHWLRAAWKRNGVFELKHTRGRSSLPFSEVKEHQISALLACKHGVFVYKISDIGMVQVPLDCFSLCGVEAFVVIKFSKHFYLIDIDDFIALRDTSPRKSLTEEMAKEKATFIG